MLRFFAKTFSTSPLNVTREIYTSLGNNCVNLCTRWTDVVLVRISVLFCSEKSGE